MNEFDLTILEADSKFYSGKCISLIVPTTEGLWGIQALHENMIAAMVIGEMKFTLPDGTEKHAAVSGGIIKVEDNSVLILADAVEDVEEIDEKRSMKEELEAQEAMIEKRSIEEYKVAQARMARAINRLKIKKKYGSYL